MTQKWTEHSEIQDGEGNYLIWPENIEIPRSSEVAFLAAQYHQETGNDISVEEIDDIALRVARKHLTEAGGNTVEAKKHWQQFTEAMDVVVNRQRFNRSLTEYRETSPEIE